jgi:NTE family protein
MPNIEHLVISGGCVLGLYEYGALKELHKKEFWNINDIKTMYSTSVGAVVACVFAMRIEFDTLDTYLVERPWQEVLKENTYHVIDAFNACGLFHKEVFYEIFRPIMKSIDMDIEITMKEFYEWTQIDIHIFVTELNKFESIDINHKTHPDWKLIDAVYASCTLPTIFAPIMEENKCYIDGGFFYNYPIAPCLRNIENHDTILGICVNQENDTSIITEDSTLIEFTGTLFNRIFKQIVSTHKNGLLKYEFVYNSPPITIEYIQLVTSSRDHRKELILKGKKDVLTYYNEWCSS